MQKLRDKASLKTYKPSTTRPTAAFKKSAAKSKTPEHSREKNLTGKRKNKTSSHYIT
jgi:hypothetical protein